MGKNRIKPNYRRRVLRLPDLDHCKLAVLDGLGSPASRRVYEYAIHQFIAWYCSEPRLAFNRIVVVRYRMYLESRSLAANTINQQLAAVRRLAHEAADSGLLSPDGCGDLCRWSVGFWRCSVRGEYQSMRSAPRAWAPSHTLHAMPRVGPKAEAVPTYQDERVGTNRRL
jgi:hypothetical protein